MRRCRARSRAWSAAESSPIMPARRAGRSSPTSTTTSSATAAARTGSATTPMSASSPKGCAGRAATSSARRSAARAARTIRPRATCRAGWRRLASDLSLGLDVRQIWRNDRFGRGGDHTEFLNAGFPAVRFSVAVENYNWQHQDLRTENGIVYGDTIERMDFPYLRRVTALNVAALAALARAPMPPAPTSGGRGVDRHDDELAACSRAATDYIVRWRRTDAANWQHSRRVFREARSSIASSRAASTRSVAARDDRRAQMHASRHPRRRLGVRRLLGRGGRVGEPGRLRGAGRRVPALCRAAACRPSPRGNDIPFVMPDLIRHPPAFAADGEKKVDPGSSPG